MRELPECHCGSRDYRAGGGTMGGSVSTRWFTCLRCAREGVEIDHYMAVFVLAKPDPELLPLDEYGNEQSTFPKAALDWINRPLFVTLRAYGEQIEKARGVVHRTAWDFYFDLLGIPRGTVFDFEREPYRRVLRTPLGEVLRDKATIYGVDALIETLHRERLSFPVPCLPQVPDCALVYTKQHGKWQLVDPAASALLKVPPDPIRRRHDAYWDDIFKQLRDAGALASDLQPTLVENGYVGARGTEVEPWYKFSIGDRHFLVGPRKHVNSIEVTSERPIRAAMIYALAMQDKVTYKADGGYNSDKPEAKKILVHAWGKEKTVDYLRLLLVEAS